MYLFFLSTMFDKDIFGKDIKVSNRRTRLISFPDTVVTLAKYELKGLSELDAWLVQLVECGTLDHGVMSFSPMVGVEFIKKKKKILSGLRY